MDINERIDKIRIKKGWSLSKLAKEAGLSETTVYDWYNENHYTPSRRAIEDVCAAFEMSLAQFFTDVEVDNLSADEMRLLELFKKVPDSKKDAVFTVIKTFID